MASTLSALIDGFFDHLWDEFPEEASGLGLSEHAARLSEHSAEAYERRAAATDGWLAKFEAVGDSGLDAEDTIDRDLIISQLRGEVAKRTWQGWKRDPGVYLGPGLGGVFELLLHRMLPEVDLARAVAARLLRIPALLEAGEANLDPDLASPIFVERARAMCKAAAHYARELVPGEVIDDERDRVADAGRTAAKALDHFSGVLERLAADAQGPYAIGADLYTTLLREREMIDTDVHAMRERGRDEYERIAAQMRDRAKDLRGTDDFIAVVRELNKDHPPTPEAMRAAYEEWTERARAFLVERDLVTLPEGEKCLVSPSPVFQRPVFAVASYNPPPMLTGDRTGTFFVPYPPDGISDEEIAERLESNAYATIPTVAVHEAYPGHHWHLISMSLNPRLVRKTLTSSYFTEGWGLYVEMMMMEQGFYDDPRHEMGVLDARLFRAARIIVDTSLHIGDMTFDEAVTFMMDKAGMAEPTARAEVGRYCTWPTQAPSYLTGCLEIERMRDEFVGGGGSLKAFHDRMGTSGALPIALAERALNDPSS